MEIHLFVSKQIAKQIKEEKISTACELLNLILEAKVQTCSPLMSIQKNCISHKYFFLLSRLAWSIYITKTRKDIMDSKIFKQEHLTQLNLLQHPSHRCHTLKQIKTNQYGATIIRHLLSLQAERFLIQSAIRSAVDPGVQIMLLSP